MSEDREATGQQREPQRPSEQEDDRGIETTTSGEPNTFEPEEDPEAAADKD